MDTLQDLTKTVEKRIAVSQENKRKKEDRYDAAAHFRFVLYYPCRPIVWVCSCYLKKQTYGFSSCNTEHVDRKFKELARKAANLVISTQCHFDAAVDDH